MRLPTPPPPTQFPDWDRAPLLQALVNALWPGVNDYLCRRARRAVYTASHCASGVVLATLPAHPRRISTACLPGRRGCRSHRLIRNALEGSLGEAGAFGVPRLERLSFGAKPLSVLGVRCLPAAAPDDPQRLESLVVLLELRWAGRPDVSLRVAGGSVQVGAPWGWGWGPGRTGR
jgi:hypothetical protein